MQINLYGVGGTMSGKIFPLKDDEVSVIGRSAKNCMIVYPQTEEGVSNVHCQVRMAYPCIELIDLGSSYGTYMQNGLRLNPHQSYLLKNGDEFCVGGKQNKFIVKVI